MSTAAKLEGEKFGRLTVIARHGTNRSKKATWVCSCECGNETIATTENLRYGYTTSCGCRFTLDKFLEEEE